MPKRPTTESHLALLRQLRTQSPTTASLDSLQKLLTDKSLHGIIIKGAAALAADWSARDLADPLAAIIPSLMEKDAAKRDPGCEGKTAALKTLIDWDADLPDLYLLAARYRQPEPTFGGSRDTAAEFRGLAAIGLAGASPAPGATDLLVDLLVDPEKPARIGAAMAWGRFRGPEAPAILRLKARTGDDDGEVTGEVLASLLQQDPTHQLDFVAEFLHSKIPGIVEGAALALGQSKLEPALPKLTAAWPALRGTPVATTLLMAIALTRSEESITWLLARFKDARPKESLALLDALAIHRGNQKILARIQSTINGYPDLEQAFHQLQKK